MWAADVSAVLLLSMTCWLDWALGVCVCVCVILFGSDHFMWNKIIAPKEGNLNINQIMCQKMMLVVYYKNKN